MAQTTLRDYLQHTEDAISSGHIEDAMTNCQHILRYFPEALDAQRLLGEVYLSQGHLEEAQQTFDWILANDPENVIVYCDRALISERVSDIDTALDCYQQAYELSRANTQIRQEFNQLSAKADQPEFMFSRAGLARLYMRGDLLTQAIQEWEVVLANNPGRLDARTGLLEAYWREGLYDQVEQLALQILEEIPGCLKALLLLAHISSARDFRYAQELVERAEALDPELAMAYDLFSDLMASQPNDPFLALLKKEPVSFPLPAKASPPTPAPSADHSAVETNGSLSPVSSSDALYGWSNMESWSELDTLTVPQQGTPSVPTSSSFATWPADTIQNIDSWASMDSTTQDEPELETWQAPETFGPDFDPALLEQQPWYQADQDQFAAPPPEAATTWDELSAVHDSEPTDVWSTEPQEAKLPAPPAWLDMLTRGEEQQPVESTPASATSPSQVEEPAEDAFAAQPEAEPDYATQMPWADALQLAPAASQSAEEPAFFFASDDKDEDMGWPEWLKSLGAATMDSEPQTEDAAALPAAEDVPLLEESWETVIDQTLSEEEEQQRIILEKLEHDLLAQGFVPLEPGTLSTIAQEPPVQEPSLSSALAQLANFTTPPAQPVEPEPAEEPEPVQALEPAQSAPTPVASDSQAEPQPSPVSPYQAEVPAQQPAEPAASSWGAPEPQTVPSYGAEALQSQVFEPVAAASNIDLAQEPPLMSAYQADALLDNELETTMKRPAIRLQPMQRPAASADATHSASKGRTGEHAPVGKIPDGHLSNKERLLKGYQYQLAGAYDDAMQEYRIIIRNAPELLGEVISNVRALLKLVPKYSLGFRILGDAYMRQGEYLQAMEAYNKALTMAKKAKGQSS